MKEGIRELKSRLSGSDEPWLKPARGTHMTPTEPIAASDSIGSALDTDRG